MSSTPRNGEPFNFQGLLEVYMIPRTIAADKKLPPGARLLWGVIRQHSMNDGRCNRSDETLAQLLGVSSRQLRRYTQVLESAGLLRSTPRPGKTPIRELLWDSRFAGKIRVGVDTNVRGGGQIRPGGRTYPSTVYKEEGSSLGSLKVNRADDFKNGCQELSELATRKPGHEKTEEEYLREARQYGWPDYIIARDLERLRRRRARTKILGDLN
jgi:DNA-binding transcriptional MocR family regulator